QTGSIAFSGPLVHGGLGFWLILIGFILNAAVPPLHPWLPDAYPRASVTGAIFLTAYTTKSAVYTLLRAFPGVELLAYMGAIMTVYGVVWAIMENDIRRLLAYHIVSQVGYMVGGVGIGTALSMNGSAAHAFCHILYKALLFMGAGAVIYSTGMRKMSDLTGRDLYKKIPHSLIYYMVGAFSISAVPLFNGFISKTMIVAAAEESHMLPVFFLMSTASIGTWLCVGL
ncbi:MAG TPA: Na+/H+ antiporter subunit D, partial [Candidatus Desulfofervidus auxilii]|nr:Na+/H+ antiporter subunit D [Candidatus Desulfofervidus auxilii]